MSSFWQAPTLHSLRGERRLVSFWARGSEVTVVEGDERRTMPREEARALWRDLLGQGLSPDPEGDENTVQFISESAAERASEYALGAFPGHPGASFKNWFLVLAGLKEAIW